jgi:choice-of-anchor C domain-containing protein
MPSSRFRSFARIAVLAALLAPASANADLITNGSFETGPVLPEWGDMYLAAGDTRLTGWTIGGTDVELANNVAWVTSDGVQTVGVNGSGTGTLSQSFASVSGTQYTVSFSLSGEPFTTPDIKHLRVEAAGQHQDFTFDVTAAWHWDMKWETKTWAFTANATTTTLTFTSLDAGDGGAVIDKVTVQTNVGVGDNLARLALAPVMPNPAAGAAFVTFELPRAAEVRLVVRDLQGRLVANLIDGARPAGQNRVRWDARAGNDLPSGLYFVSLTAEGRTLVRRVSLVRGR